jgi:hypothetical protein
VKATSAHRQADHAAIKENHTVTPLRPRNVAHRASRGAVLLTLFASLACLSAAGPAAAASPWWHLSPTLRPANLQPGGEGTIVLQALNVGDAPTSGPVTLSLALPAGATVKTSKKGVPQVSFFGPVKSPTDLKEFGPTSASASLEFCQVGPAQVTCTTKPEAPEFGFLSHIAPYEQLEVRVQVKDESALPGSDYTAEVSGASSPSVSRQRPLTIAEGEPSFGAEDLSLVPEEEGGSIETSAGAHPFQLTATFNFNQSTDPGHPPALAKDLQFELPPGQLANVTTLPKCTMAQFSALVLGSANLCPDNTVIGVASVSLFEPATLGLITLPVPLVNLEPKRGEPARFGFEAARTPIILDSSVRSGPGGDYGVTVSAVNITQVVNFIASTVTFWGTPGDPRHAESRGWGCLASEHWLVACNPSNPPSPPAFLSLPTNCAVPYGIRVQGVSWPTQAAPAGDPLAPFEYTLADNSGTPRGLTACNQVPFTPQIHSEPTSDAASSPTGLDFEININDEGELNPEGLVQSQIKKTVVTLPQGFTTNPSVAEGLKACTLAQYEAEEVGFGADSKTGCPNESKVGDVEIESPLVEQKVFGSLFVAKQGENPNGDAAHPGGNLLTLYLVAKNSEIGVIIKQALKVVPDPLTGQLTTEVDNIPQIPFSHFRLSFRSGQRSPLITPPTCGTYTVNADLYPYSNPTVPLHGESSFQITQGPEDLPCPTGNTPPFHPNLEAGTVNNRAGSFSPFYTHITRKDSEQEITHFSIKLPPGVSGKLAGIPECSDAGVAAAKAREHEGGGTEELNAPSCPLASEVGHSLVGSGVGNVLAYAPGKLYLAGPYHGSNLSLVSITAAKVGPFDLGTVVVRFALKIDPETAEVSVDGATSDPIPHIVDGIPVHLRDIRAYVDRPQFVLNPTSCKKTSTASTVLGSGLNFASEADDVPVTVTSPFQAADCAALAFKPKLALSLKGGTKRGATPAFKAVLTFPKGNNANIAESQVTLPHSEFLEQSHIGTVCTRPQFKEGKVPGEKCPAASVYGRARAFTPILSEPLEGPVYLRSSSHNLPDLVAALHNSQVDIALDGRIDSVENGRIRNTFEAVPDAPVSKFVLEMQGGKKGLLVNSTNICKTTHKAISHFVGQNGKVYDTNPVLQSKCPKAKKKGKAKKGKRAARAKG